MSHLPQESFQINSAKKQYFSILNSIASIRQKKISQVRTNREGALLSYSRRRGAYYSIGRTNREGRSNRGSTVSVDHESPKSLFGPVTLMACQFRLLLCSGVYQIRLYCKFTSYFIARLKYHIKLYA